MLDEYELSMILEWFFLASNVLPEQREVRGLQTGDSGLSHPDSLFST